MAIDQDKLQEFLVKAVVDFGATFNAALIRIGDKLGLYKALAAGGPQTSTELAKKTGTAERYVREWLSAQAAGAYVTYNPENGKFHLSEEQAFACGLDWDRLAYRIIAHDWRSAGRHRRLAHSTFHPLPVLSWRVGPY